MLLELSIAVVTNFRFMSVDILLLLNLGRIYPFGSNIYCILIDTIIIDRELIFYLRIEE